jgi:hypothetical protein
MTAVATEKLTASDLRLAIAERYEAPEWHLETEVTLGGRRLDVVAFNLWGARSYRVVGFEIKVARGDWLKELSQFQKAEEWTAVCDEFYVVTPPKLVKPEEMPLEWGHLELCGSRMMTKKYPAKREAGATLPREVAARFFTRLARALENRERTEDYQLRQALRQEIEAETVARIERTRGSDIEHLRERSKELDAIYAALGMSPSDFHRLESVLRLGKLIHAAGIDTPYFKGKIERMARDMEDAAKPLRELATTLDENPS